MFDTQILWIVSTANFCFLSVSYASVVVSISSIDYQEKFGKAEVIFDKPQAARTALMVRKSLDVYPMAPSHIEPFSSAEGL